MDSKWGTTIRLAEMEWTTSVVQSKAMQREDAENGLWNYFQFFYYISVPVWIKETEGSYLWSKLGHMMKDKA